MKHLKSLKAAFVISVFCLMLLQINAQEKAFTSSDIIGKWNLVKDESVNNDDFKYKSLAFLDNSKVEVLIADSEGERRIEGVWEMGNDKDKDSRSSNFQLISDVKITFDRNENNRVINMLRFKEEKNKKYLSGYKTEFQKESNL